MNTTTVLTQDQLAEMSGRTLDLCLKVARNASGFMIDHLLTDADAAVMANHAEAGAAVRLEILLCGGMPTVRMVLQTRDAQDIELARIQSAVIQ